MQLTGYQPGDAAALSALIVRCLTEVNARHYPPEEIERLAAAHSPNALRDMRREGEMLVARLDGQPVGVARLVPAQAAGEMELRTVFVAPNLQGRGVGRALMARAEERARQAGAGRLTLLASRTAVGFYRRLGYHPAGGETPQGLLPMQKRLDGPGNR